MIFPFKAPVLDGISHCRPHLEPALKTSPVAPGFINFFGLFVNFPSLVIGGLAANKKHKHRLVPKQRLAICWRYGTGPWQWNNHNNHMGWFLRQTINRKTWGLSYRFWNSGSFLTNFWLEESHLDCGHFLLLCLAEKWLTSWDSPKLGTHPMVLRCFYLRVPYIYIYILLYLIDSMCSNRFQPYIPHIYIYIYIYIHLCVPTGFQPPVMDHFPYENWSNHWAYPEYPEYPIFRLPQVSYSSLVMGNIIPWKLPLRSGNLTVCHGKSPCY